MVHPSNSSPASHFPITCSLRRSTLDNLTMGAESCLSFRNILLASEVIQRIALEFRESHQLYLSRGETAAVVICRVKLPLSIIPAAVH
jgi:hypothetical protein